MTHLTRTALTTALLLSLSAATAFAEGQPGGHFLENWDQNGDGTVTLAELQEKRGDVFYTFDADDNGLLDAEEYAMFDAARANDMEGQGSHARGQMKHVQEGMTLAFNDADGDGIVSRDEFIAKAADWLALIDRDGSADLSAADFGPKG